jgi:hypothetical protein
MARDPTPGGIQRTVKQIYENNGFADAGVRAHEEGCEKRGKELGCGGAEQREGELRESMGNGSAALYYCK